MPLVIYISLNPQQLLITLYSFKKEKAKSFYISNKIRIFATLKLRCDEAKD